jgi:hypothetical protein
MKTVFALVLASVTAAMLALSGCGGGSGGGSLAGIGGTGKIASGTISGFGSIFVNSDEYDVDLSTCDVDDQDVTGNCEANLRIGMVVTVVSDDYDSTTRTGTATAVRFDDDVEGPVSGLFDDAATKRFQVLGTTVVVDAASTVFDDSTPGFGYDTIVDNDVVEVSGLFDAGGVLTATYIEKQGVLNPGSTEVELKGTVSGAGAGAGEGDSFTVNGVSVTIDIGADLSDVPGGLVTDGLFVEAKGVYVNATQINASRVEAEDDVFGNDEDDVSLEGLVSDFVGISNFKVAGRPVNASSATLEPTTLQLSNGLRVEVEGPIVNGILVADKVEAEGGGIKVNAGVASASVAAGTITLTLGTMPALLTVTVDSETEFEDDNGADLTVADVNNGDFLEVRAFDNGGGDLVATEIRRSADSDNDVILQGPLDDFDTAANTITVLGIGFVTDGSTDYEDADDVDLADAAAFDALVNIGDIVKIKDNDPPGPGMPNGTADEVDLES